jgi:choline dehydrogenase-like flavoprotein
MDDINRRDFLKKSGLGTLVLTASSAELLGRAVPAADLQQTLVAALGDLFVPSAPGDPGYKDLEKYGITEYVLKNLPVGEGGLLEGFNETAKQFFGGKSFLELDEKQKEQYLELVLDEHKIADPQVRSQLLAFYRAARRRILTVYFQNYPEHEVKHNPDGTIVFKPGDTHQITNPNTKNIVTGWDITGHRGPLDWEEEQSQRKLMKKTLHHWDEGDYVRLNGTAAAPAIKTSDGNDYYDVVVVGGGSAGCIVAGRLAERGMNPKTGDRLRVAMIEAGPDWTIRDPAIRPGYGSELRRSMVPNISYDPLGTEGPLPAGHTLNYNVDGFKYTSFKIVGGSSIHWGANGVLPEEDDLRVYRETSGVDWTLGKYAPAIEEIRDIYHSAPMPEETYPLGSTLYTNAGRALGLDMTPMLFPKRNCIHSGYCGDGHICRYDAKGTSLPWAYIGLNNGLKVIANAEVQKVLIEKVAGRRPVATGVVYRDEAGRMHEVKAARVVLSTGTFGTPVMLYASGYGPRDYLGTKLIVENKNVGAHLDGDAGVRVRALWPEPLRPVRGASAYDWANMKPGPRGELTVKITGSKMASWAHKYPHPPAFSEFAPGFGMDLKDFMRDGWRRLGNLTNYLEVLPWDWRVKPDGSPERISYDEAKISATIKEVSEINRAIYEKMEMRPIKISNALEEAKNMRPGHQFGTARAGSSPANSVCTSDFDCHDIDNLIIASAAAVPRRTFGLAMVPLCVASAYAWRRIVANHFTRGSSTKGFA